MDIILVHGYNVTSTKTYGVLPDRLKKLGFKIKDVYLGKYITLDNDLSLPDLVRAFQSALEDIYGAKLETKKFACITHSTGGLVLRGWIDTYYRTRMKSLPVSHLIMLSPPNHGSRLAALGKSRLSRLRSLWGVEPGLKILDALEMGSNTQWDLNTSWMDEEIYSAPNFYPVVISGQWIDKKIWDVIVPATYERGSDGVVRVCSANLNMSRFTFDENGKFSKSLMQGIPFLLLPKTSHSDENFGIMGSVPSKGDWPLLTALVQVLNVKNKKAYAQLEVDFSAQTQALQKAEPYQDGTSLHRYSQLIVKVTDQRGNRLSDYAIELIDDEKRGDQFPSGFLPHSTQNSSSPEFFVYYLDYDLLTLAKGHRLGLRVQCVSTSPLVSYEDVVLMNDNFELEKFLRPNETTYLHVVMKRRLNKTVFQLTKNISYQKIIRQPGPDWID